MIPLAITLAALLIVLAVDRAVVRVTRELRAIAEQEADERRNRGLEAGIAAFDRQGRTR